MVWRVVFWFKPHPGLGSYLAEVLGGPAEERQNLKAVYLPERGLQVTITVRSAEDAYGAVAIAADGLGVELRSAGIAMPEATYGFGSRLGLEQIYADPYVETEDS
jgi:hypothetical protein